jgi:hypothetical protein
MFGAPVRAAHDREMRGLVMNTEEAVLKLATLITKQMDPLNVYFNQHPESGKLHIAAVISGRSCLPTGSSVTPVIGPSWSDATGREEALRDLLEKLIVFAHQQIFELQRFIRDADVASEHDRLVKALREAMHA